eukprot:11860742-Alexandrium_andersonii.AAC.1
MCIRDRICSQSGEQVSEHHVGEKARHQWQARARPTSPSPYCLAIRRNHKLAIARAAASS